MDGQQLRLHEQNFIQDTLVIAELAAYVQKRARLLTPNKTLSNKQTKK